MCHTWGGGGKLYFGFFSIVQHASTKHRMTAPWGMAIQHLWTLERVPVNKELLTGTVPVNKELLTGTVPVSILFLNFIDSDRKFKSSHCPVMIPFAYHWSALHLIHLLCWLELDERIHFTKVNFPINSMRLWCCQIVALVSSLGCLAVSKTLERLFLGSLKTDDLEAIPLSQCHEMTKLSAGLHSLTVLWTVVHNRDEGNWARSKIGTHQYGDGLSWFVPCSTVGED